MLKTNLVGNGYPTSRLYYPTLHSIDKEKPRVLKKLDHQAGVGFFEIESIIKRDMRLGGSVG